MSHFYDINVLVNGSRCKQYHHNGRIFIEAKDGSEYSVEIKNNTWGRILACVSVDGLNILNGKTATENGPGYVINGYSSNRYDGFRVSDDQVAKFIFGKKGQSYAASKEDGSERNVGVIGVRIYAELVKPQPFYLSSNTGVLRDQTRGFGSSTGDSLPPQPTIWCDNTMPVCDSAEYSCESIPTKGIATKGISSTKNGISRGSSGGRSLCGCSAVAPDTFDMGTKWGGVKESRVVEVEFEKGLLALSFDVYYASRQSLVEIGVPIGNEKQVNFPSSFADEKYAKPPKNWRG